MNSEGTVVASCLTEADEECFPQCTRAEYQKYLHWLHPQTGLKRPNTYRLVAVSLIVEHSGSLGSIAPGLHGPQPHLVLWETLQQMNRWV